MYGQPGGYYPPPPGAVPGSTYAPPPVQPGYYPPPAGAPPPVYNPGPAYPPQPSAPAFAPGPVPFLPGPGIAPPPESSLNMQELVFDPDFYHNKYPDLQSAFHHDNNKLKTHWHNHGIKEGRACSEVLDLQFYLQNHPDLQRAFGFDYQKVYDHYFRHGIKELRQSSPTFNPQAYKSSNPFLASYTPAQLVWHYMMHGRRQAVPPPMNYRAVPLPPMVGTPQDMVFDPNFYHNKYPDLQSAFHHDNNKLKTHWHNHGIKEGRACSEVLDLQFYLQNHPDLQSAFGFDYQKVYDHYFRHGIKELRQSSPTFNPRTYQERYGLQGMEPLQIVQHYLFFGRSHGLSAI